jgi:hypothetical protein
MPFDVVLGYDLEQYNPAEYPASPALPISCAVTTLAVGEMLPLEVGSLAGVLRTANGAGQSVSWMSANGDEWLDASRRSPDFMPDAEMNDLWLHLMVDEMVNAAQANIPVVTWHGAAYDLQCLAFHTERWADMRIVALDHIDLHLLFMAVKRHRLGLKTAAAAVGSHKGGGVIEDGAEAAANWPENWQAALAYCQQDVRATLDIYEHLAQYGGFNWISSKGRVQTFKLPAALRDPRTWTVRYLLTEYVWPKAPKWITAPASPDDEVFDWLQTSLKPSPLPVKAAA